MTDRIKGGLVGLGLLLALGSSGCVSQGDLNQAVQDQVHLEGRMMGFALDAEDQALQARLAILQAYQKDPRLPVIERHLGTLAQVQSTLDEVQASRRSLEDEFRRLKLRYQTDD